MSSHVTCTRRRAPEMPFDWLDSAECRDASPELFFDPYAEKEALKYCAVCPVTLECFIYANQHDGDGMLIGEYGIWGGIRAKNRRDIRRSLKTVSANVIPVR